MANTQGNQNPHYSTEIASVSGHMEALLSAYVLFHFCHIQIPRIWNLSLKYIVAKCVMLQKHKRFCRIILYCLLTLKCEIKILCQQGVQPHHYIARGTL